MHISPIFTSIIWINGALVLVRLRYFEWRFEGISPKAKLQSRARRQTFANSMDRGTLNFFQRAITKSNDAAENRSNTGVPGYGRSFTRELFSSNFSNIFSQRNPYNASKYSRSNTGVSNNNEENQPKPAFNNAGTASTENPENVPKPDDNIPQANTQRLIQFGDLPKPSDLNKKTEKNRVEPNQSQTLLDPFNEAAHSSENSRFIHYPRRQSAEPADFARSISLMHQRTPVFNTEVDDNLPFVVKDPFSQGNLIDDEDEYNKSRHKHSHPYPYRLGASRSPAANQSATNPSSKGKKLLRSDNPFNPSRGQGQNGDSTSGDQSSDTPTNPAHYNPPNRKSSTGTNPEYHTKRHQHHHHHHHDNISTSNQERSQDMLIDDENEELERQNISRWRAKLGLISYHKGVALKNLLTKIFLPWKWFNQTKKTSTNSTAFRIFGGNKMNIDGPKSISISNYLSWNPTIQGNSVFVQLTSEQKEEMGGIEYRSLKLLAKVLSLYYFGFLVIAAFCLAPWAAITRTYRPIFEKNAVNPIWWGIFLSQSAFNNVGLTLTSDSLLSFYTAKYFLLITSVIMFVGYSGFPCTLRFVLWVMHQLTDPRKSTHESLTFLLEHPRRCFTLLFPATSTWWLLAINIILYCSDLFFYVVLGLSNNPFKAMHWGDRVVTGVFQAASTRTSGFTVINLATIHPAIQVSYAIMMYISVFPIAMSMRNTNVYEEKSLGVYKVPTDSEESESSTSSSSSSSSESESESNSSDDESIIDDNGTMCSGEEVGPSDLNSNISPRNNITAPSSIRKANSSVQGSVGINDDCLQAASNNFNNKYAKPRTNIDEFDDLEAGLSQMDQEAQAWASQKAYNAAQHQHDDLVTSINHRKMSGSAAPSLRGSSVPPSSKSAAGSLHPTTSHKILEFAEPPRKLEPNSPARIANYRYSNHSIGPLDEVEEEDEEEEESDDGRHKRKISKHFSKSKKHKKHNENQSTPIKSQPVAINKLSKLPRLDVPGLSTSWGSHIQRQLSFDIWFLFIAFFILCIIEGGRIGNDYNGGKISVFDIMFETLSAYCTVGMSLGYINTDPSLSAQFSVLGKLVICVCLWRGRHRGLPYAVDRAVLLPSDLEKNDDDQELRVSSRFYSHGPNGAPTVPGQHIAIRGRSGSVYSISSSGNANANAKTKNSSKYFDDWLNSKTASGSTRYQSDRQKLKKRGKLKGLEPSFTMADVSEFSDSKNNNSDTPAFRRGSITLAFLKSFQHNHQKDDKKQQDTDEEVSETLGADSPPLKNVASANSE